MAAGSAASGQLRLRVEKLLSAHVRVRRALQAAANLAFGFVLAGAGIGESHAPLALAAVCAQPFGINAVCCYTGAVLGYGVFWGVGAALEPLAAGFLLLAGSCLFSELLPRQRQWFAPLAAGGVYLLLGLIFLLRERSAPRAVLLLGVRLALLTGAVRALCAQEPARRMAQGVGLLAGLVRVQLPFAVPLAAPLAAALCTLLAGQPQGLVAAVSCGLMLDIGCTPDPPQTALFCLAALAAGRCAPRRLARAAAFAAAYLAGAMLWGGAHAGWTLGVMLGAAGACLLPQTLLPVQPAEPALPEQLETAAGTLQALQRQMEPVRTPDAPGAAALIFDRAADTVCRGCLRREQCWVTCAEQTYHALCGCADTIVRRGEARQEDLPSAFAAVCIRLPAFCEAATDALRAQRVQLQALARCAEARRIACAAYGHAAQMLHAMALPPDSRAVRYEPELGVRAVGLRGDTLCGDCGASFRCRAVQYVLLLDGMGTGAEARADAEAAIALLRQLLCLQMPPDEALQLLNEAYVLRGDGCFSTVDLLQLDLTSGEGLLYKWGAAPSFLRLGANVKKIGTASPPPGLGVGEKHRAECVRLSLQRGEQLVLTTDGVPEGALEQYLRTCGALSPRELAAGAVACASESEPDDRTAAVVQLRPVALQPHHITRGARKASNPDTMHHI